MGVGVYKREGKAFFFKNQNNCKTSVENRAKSRYLNEVWSKPSVDIENLKMFGHKTRKIFKFWGFYEFFASSTPREFILESFTEFETSWIKGWILTYLSLPLFNYLFIYLSIYHLFNYLFIYLSFYFLFNYLFIYLSSRRIKNSQKTVSVLFISFFFTHTQYILLEYRKYKSEV